jgi:hypothetical protein
MKNPLQLIDKRGLKIMLGIVLLLTLISVITIVLTVSGRNRRSQNVEQERMRREEQALSSSTNFGMEDFFLDFRNPGSGAVYPVRQPGGIWNIDEVENYWIDPAQAGLDTISEKNDRIIMELLGVNPDRAKP